jgi:hypothetical protein
VKPGAKENMNPLVLNGDQQLMLHSAQWVEGGFPFTLLEAYLLVKKHEYVESH